jgi:hypothetical protein
MYHTNNRSCDAEVQGEILFEALGDGRLTTGIHKYEYDTIIGYCHGTTYWVNIIGLRHVTCHSASYWRPSAGYRIRQGYLSVKMCSSYHRTSSYHTIRTQKMVSVARKISDFIFHQSRISK